MCYGVLTSLYKVKSKFMDLTHKLTHFSNPQKKQTFGKAFSLTLNQSVRTKIKNTLKTLNTLVCLLTPRTSRSYTTKQVNQV